VTLQIDSSDITFAFKVLVKVLNPTCLAIQLLFCFQVYLLILSCLNRGIVSFKNAWGCQDSVPCFDETDCWSVKGSVNVMSNDSTSFFRKIADCSSDLGTALLKLQLVM
jgi:hypothetical protein